MSAEGCRCGEKIADVTREAGARALEEAALVLVRLPYVKPGAAGRAEYERVLAVRRGNADEWLKERAMSMRAGEL